MEVMTRKKLHELTQDALKKIDNEIIENIAQHVYNQVIHTSQYLGQTSLKWNIELDYMFGSVHHIRFVHIVRACVRLKQLFPDSKVTHTTKEIEVDWS